MRWFACHVPGMRVCIQRSAWAGLRLKAALFIGRKNNHLLEYEIFAYPKNLSQDQAASERCVSSFLDPKPLKICCFGGKGIGKCIFFLGRDREFFFWCGGG